MAANGNALPNWAAGKEAGIVNSFFRKIDCAKIFLPEML